MIYFNGEILPADQVQIRPEDRGFLLGDGVFETIPVFQGIPFKLLEHLERLKRGAEITKIKLATSIEAIQSSIQELIDKNNLSNADAIIRITLTRGPGPRGLSISLDTSPTIMMTVSKWLRKPATPVHVLISKHRRNEFSAVYSIKSLNFLENILAKNEAETALAQDAILLNTAGNLAESTASNLFLVKDAVLSTPKISDGVLPGITREAVLSLAKKLGIKIIEASLPQKELISADEAFLTNSLVGVQPILQVDNKILGESIGPISKQLSDAYLQLIKRT